MSKRLQIITILLPTILCIVSCASKVMPSGGDKDTTPPAVLHSVPKNYSTFYNGSTIEIHFDEYIQLSEVEKNIIVTPFTDTMPEIKVKNKSIYITFLTENKSNTTYTIQFGNSIKDLNEGNVLNNFRYVFSTGPFIDSLGITFQVKDAESGLESIDYLVMAYHSSNDSVLFNQKPDYFSRTNDKGQTSLNNMAAGTYQIFALKDENNNFIYDSENESVAAYPQTIELPFTDTLLLKSYQPDWPVYIKNIQAMYNGKALAVLNRKNAKASFELLDSTIYAHRWNQRFDTLEIWYSNTLKDYLNIHITTEANTELIDSVYIAGKQKIKPPDIKAFPVIYQNSLFRNDSLTVLFSMPLKKVIAERISLSLNDSNLTFSFFHDNAFQSNIKYAWLKDSIYHLNIFPGALVGFDDRKNTDTLGYTFQIVDEDHYGNLFIQLDAPLLGINYRIELINDRNELYEVQYRNGNEKFSFQRLNPGIYKLRCIVDMNQNKKWDKGDVVRRIPSEHIILYNGELNIRANWDLEVEWKIRDFE